MATESESIRYEFGAVEIDDEAVVFRKSPRLFLASQLAQWRSGRPDRRLKAVALIFGFVGYLALAINEIYWAVLSDVWWATGPIRQPLYAGVGLLVTVRC